MLRETGIIAAKVEIGLRIGPQIEKDHCKQHEVDFEKYIKIKVSCPRYQQCREEATERHETNIAEAKLEAQKKGRQWAAVKAVLQIVCPHEEPPKCIPEIVFRKLVDKDQRK